MSADSGAYAPHAHPGHAHGAPRSSWRFGLGIALNLLFVAGEVAYGLRAHSLALIADAGHNLGDALGLLLALAAALAARRPPSHRHTYGMRRASILAALANAILLLVVVGGIAWEAIGRFAARVPVAGGTVMLVAAAGVAVNGLAALLFLRDRKDLNVRAAFAHMLSDAAVSLGVVIAGLAIRLTGRAWLDPAVSLAIAVVIVFGTWELLRESLRLAMDGVPVGVDLPAVEAFLRALPGVTTVHDLHIWGMSTTEVALTAHLVKPDAQVDDAVLERLARELHDRFGIEHTTIQLEHADERCGQAGGSSPCTPAGSAAGARV